MARHRHKSHKRTSKNIINKTVDKSVSVVKSTSQKIHAKGENWFRKCWF